METKQCTKCGENKLLSEYYKNRSSYYGIRSECKLCTDKASYEYKRNKYQSDEKYRIINNISHEFKNIIKCNKSKRTFKYLGCELPLLLAWLDYL